MFDDRSGYLIQKKVVGKVHKPLVTVAKVNDNEYLLNVREIETSKRAKQGSCTTTESQTAQQKPKRLVLEMRNPETN